MKHRWLVLAPTLLLAGCALFRSEVDTATQRRLQQAVPSGTPVDKARSRLGAEGFACELRKGPYVDGEGREHAAERILACTRRPGAISFECQRRDQAYVLVEGGYTGRMFLTHGPSCEDI